MRQQTILFGVCGIANGHAYRQLPFIEYFAQKHKICIFAYGTSLVMYRKRFTDHPNITIAQVGVPFFAGKPTGLDFAASARHGAATPENYAYLNCLAMDTAERAIGKPDLVISDYEPVSAQYAYAYHSPFVTIDQQSKYLSGIFPKTLAGQTYTDEVMRLRMFFPQAAARFACSFFRVAPQPYSAETVQVVPPIFRPELQRIRQAARRDPRDIVVYLTSQQGLGQTPEEILDILATQTSYRFYVFLPETAVKGLNLPAHVMVYPHGTPAFQRLLGICSGIIATAGHTLLSEAMYLGIPVYALPLPLYEQQMNAHVIAKHAFGVNSSALQSDTLQTFLTSVPRFAKRIARDHRILLKGDGKKRIINYLERNFLFQPRIRVR